MKKKIKNVSKTSHRRKKKRAPRMPLSKVPERMNLEAVEKLYGSGLIDEQVADACGVSVRTINRRKHNARFMAVVKQGRSKANERIVRSLFKRAEGYNYAEVTMERVLSVHQVDGVKKKELSGSDDLVVTKTVIKHVPADEGAIEFYLTNRMPDEFKKRLTFSDADKPVEPRTYLLPVVSGVLQVPKS